RVRVHVRGVVQGVGFRPFVWRLARELELDGWVRNDAEGVEIDATGRRAEGTSFLSRLREEAPPPARVESVEVLCLVPGEPGEPREPGPMGFRIAPRDSGSRSSTAIGPDVAVCRDCLAELFAPGDRRHRYPFINCTQCGPRFTITRRLPYDRTQTSMAPFALCAACRREYTDPADRRFHAEPNACPACGPHLRFADRTGRAISVEDPIAAALAAMGRGELLAIKGLGGFHLSCDARNSDAVARLRTRKLREARPF